VTYVSQSGLSAAIKSLEAELGTALFTRTTRSVELTPAGRALLPHAEALLAGANAGRDAVTATLGELTGELRIGSEQCLTGVDVTDLLDRFHRCHPRVQLAFVQAGSADLLTRLVAGELDLAFVAGGSPSPLSSRLLAGLSRTTLATEPLVVLCRADDPLAGQRKVSWSELAGRDFIDFATSWAMRMLSDELFDTHGVRRRVAVTVTDVHTLLDMVNRGLGVAVVPMPIARKPQASELVQLGLADDYASQWTISLALAPVDHSGGAAARFCELVPGFEPGSAG